MKLKYNFLGRLWPSREKEELPPYISYFPGSEPRGFWAEYKWAVVIFAVALLVLLGDMVFAQGLKAGDPVPDIVIHGVWNNEQDSVRLSEYRGKVLVLDFWATWCAPCVGMIPKMDALQQEFAGRVQFLSVSAEPETVVKSFMERLERQQGNHYVIPQVSGDTVLGALFPHHAFPHYVWIGPDGRVAAITGFEAVDRVHLQALLDSGALRVAQKHDAEAVPYDYQQPLLVGGNGGDGSNLLYHSVLTSYTAGLHTGKAIVNDPVAGKKITCKNCSLHQLFELAWSDSGRNFNALNTRYAVKDVNRIMNLKDYGQRYRDWLSAGNGFCYELKVPPALGGAAPQMMREDLQRFFTTYHVAIVRVQKQCLVLSRKGKAALATEGGKPQVALDRFHWQVRNCTLGVLAERLNYMQVMALPVVDESGLADPVDLEVDLPAQLSDLDQLNAGLGRSGLRLSRELRTVEELVISDAAPKTPQP